MSEASAGIEAEFSKAIEQFNQAEFYACHDTLEAIWMDATHPDKTFYQGILQISVGLYHLGHANWQGAVILLGEGIYRLRDFQPHHAQIDVERLVCESATLLRALQIAGIGEVGSIAQLMRDRSPELHIPKIHPIPE
jgi:predicted metal-dependent hydrolase